MEINSNDLDQIIEDSLNDSMTPDEPTPEPVEASGEVPVEEPVENESIGVPAPGAVQPVVEEDAFAKQHGVKAIGATGNENRIPYSRVKKIVANAEKAAETRAREALKQELEGSYTPRITEFETKVRDYEGRLEKMAHFENMLENDPREFLGRLSKVPAYKEFFEFVERAAGQMGSETPAQAQPGSDMPQPDVQQPDGSAIYSMEGLQALLKWQSDQTEQRTVKQLEERYRPIEQKWQSDQEFARMVPIVEKQIAEARTWDKFNELEPKITEIIKNDRSATIEKAYMKAYQAYIQEERQKWAADRNTVRSEVLEEIKNKPMASSAPTGSVKPGPQVPNAPRSLEDAIWQSLEDAGLK